MKPRRNLFLGSYAAITVAFTAPYAIAQTNGTWDGGGATAIWGGVGNWDPDGTIANGIGATATFGTGFASGTNIQVNTDRTIGNINHNSTTTDITISQINSSIFTLDVASGSPTVTVGTAARTLTISAPISGADGMTKAGAGTLVLSGANNYTGTTILSAGTLVTGNTAALGAAGQALTLNGGTLHLATDSALSSKNVTLGGNIAITLDRATSGAGFTTSFGNLTSNTGSRTLTVTKGANVTDASTLSFTGTLSVSGQTTTFDVGSGATVLLSGASATGAQTITMVKSGSGSLILAGNYATWDAGGATQLNGGTLELRSLMGDTTQYRAALTAAAGTTLRLVNNTSTDFMSNFTANGSMSIVADRLTSAATSTTHTLGTLSIGASTLSVSRGASITGAGVGGVTFGNASLSGAASFSTAADSQLTLGGTTALGANTLTKSGPGSMTLTGVVSGTKAAGSTAIALTGGTLIVSSGTNTFTGNLTVDGASSVLQMASGSNGNATSAPLGIVSGGTAYKTVTLSNGGTFRPMANYNVNVPSATSPGNGYVFSIGSNGGTFDVGAGVTFTIDDGSGAGTATTNAQLQGSGTLTKTGVGTLSLGNNTSNFSAFTGAIIVNAGTLTTGAASTNPLGTTTTGTTINSGAALNVGSAVWTAAEPLTINGTGLASAPAGALTASGAGTWVGPVTIAAGGATIGGGAGNLTLSSTATINGTAGNTTLATGAGTLTLNGTVNIGGNTLTMSQGAGRATLNSTAVISGTGSVVVNGSGLAGDWANNAAHTYSGGTTLNAGSQSVVGVSSVGVGGGVTSGNFGTGTLVLNGGSMRGGVSGPFTVGNNVTLQADTSFYTTASEKSLIFAGPVTMTGASRTLSSTVGTTVAGSTVEFSGAIGDGGNNLGLTKAGLGNLTLSGANTYTGGTGSTGGNLLVTGSLANNTGLSIIPAAASGAVISFVNNAANTPANFSSLTLGSAAGTSFLGLDLGTSSDTIATSAAATATNDIGFHLNAASGFGAGSYSLISAASGLTAGGAAYSLGSVPGGYTYSFTNSDSLVQLNVTAATASNRYWVGNLNNSWASFSGVSTTNWATDAAGTTVSASTPGAGDTVLFSATNATGPAITTTLDNNFAFNDLQFLSAPTGVTSVAINPGVNPNTAGLGTLTLAPSSSSAGITLAQGAGAVTIAAPMTLGAAQTWTVDSSTPGAGTASSLNVSGAISGSAANGLTFTNTGGTTAILLSGVNTYSGPSTVSVNTIVQGGAANSFSPNTAWTVNGTLNTGAFSNNTGSLVGGTGIVQNGSATNATLTIGSDNVSSATFAGTIQNGSTGTLGITKAGTGLQILSGTNTYTGTTTVTAGTLQIANAAAYPATSGLVVNGTGTFDLFGNSLTAASLGAGAATGTITNGSTSTGASTATTPGTPSGAGIYVDALTATGALGGAVTNLLTDGATRKTQIIVNNANSNNQITSNSANTFSGGLVLAHNASGGTRLGIGTITGTPWGTGPIIIGQAATDKAGIYFANAGQTLANDIVFNTALGTDRVGIRADGAAVLSGKITANLAPATFTSNNATAGAFTLTNQVTGANGLVLDITSLSAAATAFNVTLNNGTVNANNYQGDTVINLNAAGGKSATLNLGQANQIPNGTGAGNVIINSNGTGIGTLNLAGFSETINGLSGNGTVEGATTGTPTNTLTLGDNNATGNVFSGTIKNTAGTLGVTKIGSGTQTFGGANTFSGPLNVTGGTLAFGAGNSLGDGSAANTIGIDGATLSYTGAGAASLTANQVVTLGASHGTIDTSSTSGALTLSGGITSANNNLTKSGPGSLILAGTTNLGTGIVAVNAGSLLVNNTFTSSTTTVANSATLGGTGTLSSAVTVNSGGMLSPATSTTAGTLTIGSLTLDAGSQLAYEFGGTSDLVVVSNASGLTLNGGALNLYATGGASPLTVNGTYDLFNYSTSFGGSLANLTVANSQSGKTYSLNDTGSIIQLVLGTAVTSDWSGTFGDGLWTSDGVGGNWNDGAQPNSLGAAANFGNLAASPQTVTLNGGKTVGSISFDNANSFTIGTNSDVLTLDNGIAAGAISATTGSHTINAPIALNGSANITPGAGTTLTFGGIISGTGKSLTFSGAGASALNAANTHSGGTTLSAGTLNLGNDAALGTGAFTIGAGTTIDNTKGSLLTNSNNNLQNWNGSFTFTGTNSMDLGNGAVTLGANSTVTTTANTLKVGGAIGDGAFNFGITKEGAGTLELGGASTYEGATSINAGTLSLTGSLGGGGAISTAGTGILSQSSTGAISGASTVTQGSSGTSVLAGTNTYSGLTSVNAGVLTMSGNNSGASGGVTLTAGQLNINSDNALGTGRLTLSGGTFDNTDAAAHTLATNPVQTWTNAASVAFTGTQALNLGTGDVTLGTNSSTGSFTLTNNSTLPGTSLTVGGNISAVAGGAAGVKTLTIAGPGNTALTGNITRGSASALDVTITSGGTTTLSGAANSIRTINLNGGASSILDLGAGSLTITNAGANGFVASAGGTINATGGGQIVLGSGAGGNFLDNGTANGTTLTVNASITGSFGFEIYGGAATNTGVTVLTAQNTFTGDVAINGGNLSVSNIGNTGSVTSNLGSGTTINSSAAALAGTTVTTGKLIYTGTGETTNRVYNLSGTTVGGAIEQAGTGLLKFTSNFTATGAGSKSLFLLGSTAGTGEIAGLIVNNSGTNTTGVTKLGTGTWELSGANTYTGATTVSEGTLILSGNRTGTSGTISVSTLAGLSATLDITAGTYALGAGQINVGNAATTAATGTVNQSGGAISFASGNGLLIGQNTVGNTGIYNMSGGSITTFASTGRGIMLGVNSNPTPGPSSGGGTFNLSGTGTLNMTAASGGGGNAILQIGRSDSPANNTTNVFNQTGGTANVGILAMGGAAGGSTGVSSTLTLTGGTFSANSFTLLAAGGTNTAVINIGGSAQVTLPVFPTNAKGAGSSATITFDSTTGFLSPLAASATYLPAGTFNNAYLTANGAKFNVGTGKDITIGQVLEDAVSPAAAGTLTKQGTGVLTLTGANAYTGATTVSAGTLLVNGSTAAASAFSVATGATLGGTGTINGAVNVTGVLSPGASIESLKTGALTMLAGSTFVFEAVDNTATGADLLAVNGTLSLTDVNLDLTNAALSSVGWTLGDKLTLISYGGSAISSGFAGFADDATYTYGANIWAFNYNDTVAGNNYTGDHNGGTNFVTFTVVPEPSSVALLGVLGSMLLLRRRR